MRILVADDDPVTRLLLARHLQRWGHEPVLTSDGEEAWRAFEAGEVSVVITDWIMPGLDGTELVRRIRAARRATYTYVVMLTARTDAEDLTEALDAGTDDFLTKPLDTGDLRARLRVAERIVGLEAKLADRGQRLEAANTELGHVNAQMRSDLEAAAAVQRGLLPPCDPAIPGVRCAWRFEPCDSLAGDLLNVVHVDDRRVAAWVLDVAGHGVAAALRAVMVGQKLAGIGDPHSDLRRRVGTPDDPVPPAAVAGALAELFPFEPVTGQYFTLVFAVLDLETRELRCASAGHPRPVVVRRDGRAELVDVSGYPVGLFTGLAASDYVEHRTTLARGDRVFLYSDGVLAPPAGLEAPEERLRAMLEDLRREPLARVVEAASSSAASGDDRDDRTVLALELE